jgi:ribokinase
MSLVPEIVVVGSHIQGVFIRVQRIPSADETVLGWDYHEAKDGGKGSHQAIACSRMGVPTSFVGCVGADRFGDIGVTWMEEAGVDLRCLRRCQGVPTGVGFVMIGPDGVPAIVSALGANAGLGKADVDAADHLFQHASVLLTVFELPPSIALYAAHQAHAHGVVTLLTPSPAEPQPPAGFPDIDVLIPNQVEAKTLLGLDVSHAVDAEDLARECQRRFGISRIVVTLGETGAIVAEGLKLYREAAVPVEVVDTPGAGDAFSAGLAVGIARGLEFREAVRLGCAMGAYAVTLRESIPSFPSLRELQRFAALHKLDASLRGALDAWVTDWDRAHPWNC